MSQNITSFLMSAIRITKKRKRVKHSNKSLRRKKDRENTQYLKGLTKRRRTDPQLSKHWRKKKRRRQIPSLFWSQRKKMEIISKLKSSTDR